MKGCCIIGDLEGMEFHREIDPTYGYGELIVKPRSKSKK